MSGSSKTRPLTRKAILGVMKMPPPGGYFVWDGKDEDDRPATSEEMKAGIAEYRRKRGRPSGSSKVSTTIRFDADVLAAFRADGPGWQSRMNSALREWLKSHR
jgi:uncharacterized protein (DUF4415 family)